MIALLKIGLATAIACSGKTGPTPTEAVPKQGVQRDASADAAHLLAPADDPAIGTCIDVTSGINPLGCPAGQCGGNSPYVNLFPITGVNVGSRKACKNKEKVTSSVVLVGGGVEDCATADGVAARRHGALGWELVGTRWNEATSKAEPVAGCEGAALTGTVLKFTNAQEVRVAYVVITRIGTIEKDRDIAYVFANLEFEPTGSIKKNEWPTLCTVDQSKAFRDALELPTDEPPRGNERANRSPASGLEMSSAQVLVGIKRAFYRSHKTELRELSGAEQSGAVLVLPGEIYDGMGQATFPAPGTPQPGSWVGGGGLVPTYWYNFACVGDGMAKAHLLKRIQFDGDASHARERQAAIRLETGIYCKGADDKWMSHTVRGVEIEVATGSSHLAVASVEGRWDEQGLLCLSRPRVHAGNRIVQRDMFPPLCQSGTLDCSAADKYLVAIKKYCDTPDRKIEKCQDDDRSYLFESGVKDY